MANKKNPNSNIVTESTVVKLVEAMVSNVKQKGNPYHNFQFLNRLGKKAGLSESEVKGLKKIMYENKGIIAAAKFRKQLSECDCMKNKSKQESFYNEVADMMDYPKFSKKKRGMMEDDMSYKDTESKFGLGDTEDEADLDLGDDADGDDAYMDSEDDYDFMADFDTIKGTEYEGYSLDEMLDDDFIGEDDEFNEDDISKFSSRGMEDDDDEDYLGDDDYYGDDDDYYGADDKYGDDDWDLDLDDEDYGYGDDEDEFDF